MKPKKLKVENFPKQGEAEEEGVKEVFQKNFPLQLFCSTSLERCSLFSQGYKQGAKGRARGSNRQGQGQSRGQNDPGWASFHLCPNVKPSEEATRDMQEVKLTSGAGPPTPYALHPDSSHQLCIRNNNSGGVRDLPRIVQRF